MTTPRLPDVTLEQVLVEGLLEQVPTLTEHHARRVAEALAYDLRATGWAPRTRRPSDDDGTT